MRNKASFGSRPLPLMPALWVLAATCLPQYSLSAANLMGGDDFNDNVKDSAKWSVDSNPLSGSLGVFTETNQRLEYTGGGSGAHVQRSWLLNQGSSVENWSIRLDTTVTTVAGVGADMGLALEVQQVGNAARRFGIGHESAQSSWDFFTFAAGSGAAGAVAHSFAASSVGALSLAYNAQTRLLASFYDLDGAANGYQWTAAATYDVSSWGLTAQDQFLVVVNGDSGNRSVNPATVYADNFAAVPEPSSFALLMLGGMTALRRRRSASANLARPLA